MAAIAVSDVVDIVLTLQVVDVWTVCIANLRHHEHEWLTWLEVLVVLCRSSLTCRNLRIGRLALLDTERSVRVVTCEVVVANLAILVTLVSVEVVNVEHCIALDERCRVNIVVAVQLCGEWLVAVVVNHRDVSDTPLDEVTTLLNLLWELNYNLATLGSCTLDVNILVSVLVRSGELNRKNLTVVVELAIRDCCCNVELESLTELKTVVTGNGKHRRTAVNLLTSTEQHHCA